MNIKDNIKNKQKSIKDTLIRTVGGILAAGTILGACAGCSLNIRNPSDTEDDSSINQTDQTNGIIKTPNDFYKDNNREFEPIELEKTIEECSGLEKLDNYLKNYLLDETAEFYYISTKKNIDSQTRNPITQICITCTSQKETNSDNNYLNIVFTTGGETFANLEQEKGSSGRTELSFARSTITRDEEYINSICEIVYTGLIEKYKDQNYLNRVPEQNTTDENDIVTKFDKFVGKNSNKTNFSSDAILIYKPSPEQSSSDDLMIIIYQENIVPILGEDDKGEQALSFISDRVFINIPEEQMGEIISIVGQLDHEGVSFDKALDYDKYETICNILYNIFLERS